LAWHFLSLLCYRQTISEPAAPQAEVTLLRPEYRPNGSFPRLKSGTVMIAPIQTSRQAIFTSGSTFEDHGEQQREDAE
jgi:hypothetical protein